MNKTKNFTTLEVINIVSYINNVMKDEQKQELPTKMKWYLKKNLDKMVPIARDFEEFRDGEIEVLQKDFFNEEKSEEYMETRRDENGNPIMDAEGNEETVAMRKVKEEFMGEYTKAVDELNTKLQEILVEKNKMEIACIDFDSFVEGLPEDTKIDFDSLNILSFMEETSNVEGAE